MTTLSLLLLLLIANGTPVLARLLLGRRLRRPLDGGRVLGDGRPLFGPSKTWAGLASALAATALAAPLLGLPWWLGASTGLLAMLGDLLSSFLKRRLGLASGAMAPGLDQIPEALLPLLLCRPLLGLSWGEVLGLPVAFMAAALAISRLLYRLGLRQHPH